MKGAAGSLAILNVGDGDTKLTFAKDKPVERRRAAKIVTDMLRRGYAIMIVAGEIKGEPVYRRVDSFDPETCEYIIVGDPPDEEEQPDNVRIRVQHNTYRGRAEGEPTPAPSATSAAAEIGSTGGKARAAKLSPERRSEIARDGARKRWGRNEPPAETPTAAELPQESGNEHEIEGASATETPAPTGKPREEPGAAPRRGRRGRQRIAAESTSAVAIGRSSGG